MRVLTIAAVLSFVTASGVLAEGYGWRLSGSDTDPNVHTGPIVSPIAPFFVYLWLDCTPVDGIAAAEFSLLSNYFVGGFTPMSGALNAGSSANILLSVAGCPKAPIVLGEWIFLDFTLLGGFACLTTSSGGVNATADCSTVNPQFHANAYIGYSNDGSTPCVVGNCGGPVSVESASWGSIKGLYR